VIVTALVQQRTDGSRDAPQPARKYLEVEAVTYEAARADVMEQLTEGWIVASWRVDRAPAARVGDARPSR